MKAAVLVKYGSAETAFEIRNIPVPILEDDEVLIKIEGFGLNYADVMARNGLYKAAPPPPSVLGYDVVGHIEKCGTDVSDLKIGDRVMAFTRFGGYAEYAKTDARAVCRISDDVSPGAAVALSTQYCTAYYLAYEMAPLQHNDHILIHAAAGGVGTALVQMALHEGCVIFGTCSTDEKVAFLKSAGVQYPIHRLKDNFDDFIRNKQGEKGLDVIFNAVGGKSVKTGFQLLGAGGRLITYGASVITENMGFFSKIKTLLQFGFYHPFQLLSSSKGIIGVNMLVLGDHSPEKLNRVMNNVVQMHNDGILKPHVGGSFDISKMSEAHQMLESNKSLGKLVVTW